MANEILAIIDRIIAEHRTIRERLESIDRVANDGEAMARIRETEHAFAPETPNDGLIHLQTLFTTLNQGLRAHFMFEETYLLNAFEQSGSSDLSQALRILLLQHNDLRDRLAQAHLDLDNLALTEMDPKIWAQKGLDMRVHLSYTHQAIAKHAASEEVLLRTLRAKVETAANATPTNQAHAR